MRTALAASAALIAAGIGYAAYHIFDGAGHGFLRGQDANPANLAAAQQAWPKTIAFFKAKLGA